MSLCNIIKLENRMYKLIPQPAAQTKTGTEEEEVRGAGRMDAACAEDWNSVAASTPTNATCFTGMCTPQQRRTPPYCLKDGFK